MRFLREFAFTAALVASGSSIAAVTAQEAEQLGKTLTPVGAELAGNKDGTIPAWTGGLKQPPVNYQPGTHLINPYPGEKPITTITKDNLDQYRDKLTPGQLALFAKYPETYKMNVYKTHRSAALPEHVYEAAKQNATTAKLISGGNGVENWKEAVPFPIPKNGLEAIWNHVTRYRGGGMERQVAQAVVQRNGDFSLIKFDEKAVTGSYIEGDRKNGDDNVLVYFMQRVTAPARLTGNVLLVHETINQFEEPRKAWIYNAGQRRVRRAPQVAYDGPGTAADGLRTADNFDMFSGSPDKYDWKLKGKKEIYIPYNNFELASKSNSYKDILDKGHLNKDLTRYELHRVWVVEASLKDGQRNIYSRRTMFIDEDTWQISIIDHYDGRDQIWRVAEGYQVQFYYANTPMYAAEVIHDLNSSRYLALGLHSEEQDPIKFGVLAQRRDFTPAAIRRMGKR
ncbi:MAG: DUF1329 domain-containing protein [Pseudomonadales bacterium]|nr:DUF1329 domain-containing protein [Pseudomonadales bacterium]